MLSYRHAFHAGNHADILKHSVLINILESLNTKDKPYTIFETHSGSGVYNLEDERSLKTNEAKQGILSLLPQMDELDFPESLSNYYKITSLYKRHKLYPGSIELERIFTRPDCVHIISELNNSEIETLKQNVSNEPLVIVNTEKKCVKTQVHHRDGFETVLALTPPAIKRGLCLIDPSYEEKDEYKDTGNAVIKIHRKWNVGIIALWYPLLAHRAIEIEQMKNDIVANVKAFNSNTNILDARLCINTADSHIETDLKDNSGPPRLYGSGMLIINFPWKLDEKTQANLDYITKHIYKNEKTSFSIITY
ncbi:MAG: 23S rRNA (adenine(2030)-N(6))-methyltransferase RlmJ [Treponema sp.]|uniref:23S rRNA (adenine(2030)-N(6))-methyltransferase RlmJ n=1 Tax=Treponema sp. TaxID=166 RepID=UPI00298DE1C3|nr:23S rRNA (adenine(2030)-N(6))-methyltransferase RlmJ [Treponema sp.]MCQ2600401.1 23S rRNA (adenine(2030)-N(6))-methyltransferase RlmJ [Treponema sp.]